MLNRVPEVTIYFWIIKILGTTVGETAADSLNADLGLGLAGTTAVATVLLIVALAVQFSVKRYIPWVYWLVVVLVSVVGTLITDNLVDNLGVPLEVATVAFAIALSATFAVWFACERTLSIHAIDADRREVFYWLAILFTFALGTAAGDLVAEQFDLGYATSTVLFGAVVAAIVLARFRFRANTVAIFWAAYVLTRPLGASLGDLLTQDPDGGGLGWGPTVTTGVFLLVIVGLVGYLTVTRVDVARRGGSVGETAELDAV